MVPVVRNGSALTPATGTFNRLSSLVDEFFSEAPAAARATPLAVIPLSLWDDESAIHVEADLPGLTEKNLDLSVHERALFIRGERKCSCMDSRFDSRRYGRFEQRVMLPADVEADAVEAQMANGVLHVTLPKSAKAKPRKIAIRTE